MPQKLWVAGEEVLATDFNDYMQNQVVATFPNTTTRTSQWGAPPEGALSYLRDADAYETFNGSTWERLGITPAGTIAFWPNVAAPAAWLLCDGASLDRTTYARLFAVVGTSYGAVDGTHFTLPDLRGRIVLGAGAGAGLTARTLAAVGGAEDETAPLPAHTHTIGGGGGWSYVAARGGGAFDIVSGPGSTEFNTTLVTDTAGPGGTHNNMPPYVTIAGIIKT